MTIAIFVALVGGLSVAGHSSESAPAASGLDQYLESDGNCVGMEKDVPAPSQEKGSPMGRSYVAFLREQVCRMTRLRDAFLANPIEFCSGALPGSFASCYGEMLRALVERPGLDVTGFTLMSALSMEYIARSKAGFSRPAEAGLAILEAGWKNLDLLDRRAKPEIFAPKEEAEEFRKGDEALASKFAAESLKGYEKSLRRIEKDVSKLEVATREGLRARLRANRAALEKHVKRWKLRPTESP